MIYPKDPNEPLTERERTLRIALKAGNIGIWDWDIVHNNIIWSDEVYDIHELDIGTDVGQYTQYQQGIHPDDRERVSALIREAIEHNEPYEAEFRIVTPTGKEKWVQARGAVIDENGTPVRMIGATRDITRKKYAELELAKSEEKFRSLSVNSPVGIFLTDSTGRLTYINPRVQELTGALDADALMKNWNTIIHPDDIDNVTGGWTRAVHERSDYRVVVRINRQDGSLIWAYVRMAPMLSDTGEYLGGTGTVEDISGRILRDQQKDDFLAMASHELKTPVTSVKAYAQHLQRRFIRKGDIESAELVRKMDVQIDRLTTLVSDLLDVSKIQSGKLLLHLSPFPINELVDEIVEQIQLTSDSHTINVTHEADLYVLADRERLGQVLINLLTNAIKYSPDATHVDVAVIQKDHFAQISVQDFGVGIPKNKQERLFERFYRVEGSHHETFPGLGLGLYISSEIVKRLNGSIWLHSEEHTGSTFYFTVPLTGKEK